MSREIWLLNTGTAFLRFVSSCRDFVSIVRSSLHYYQQRPHDHNSHSGSLLVNSCNRKLTQLTQQTNKSICNAVSVMFVPLQSSTLRRRLGRNAVRLACRQNLVSAATASAVTGAVHSAPAPLASTILIPPWQSCSLAQRRRSTCKNSFYHPHLTFV